MAVSGEADGILTADAKGWNRASWKILRLGFQLLLPFLSYFYRFTALAAEMPAVDPRAGFHAWMVTRFGRSRGDRPEDRRQPSFLSLALLDGPASKNVSMTDLTIGSGIGKLAARLYRPRSAPQVAPVLIYLHFGGCVLGDLETCHTACSLLAEHSGCLILSVAYRLAPEHRFPAAVDDVLTAFDWTQASAKSLGIDASRIAVGGDSAGGYLAVAASLCLRDNAGKMPFLQVLIYPVVDMDRTAMPPTAFDNCYPLTRNDMIWFAEQYMRDASDADDPRCSVARAKNLSGLPPTILVQAGNDILEAEGSAFGQRLANEGNDVTTLKYPSLPHAFTAMSGGVPKARDALIEIARTLCEHMNSPRKPEGSRHEDR
ncbi:MAG: alpha/beta hydrolase [Hyphomicrobium sp.]|uniref:alpha/beta hydrolase n=1 Tax=Hyphomicrobium sp. TaxID=82 RepID=UPI0039E64159